MTVCLHMRIYLILFATLFLRTYMKIILLPLAFFSSRFPPTNKKVEIQSGQYNIIFFRIRIQLTYVVLTLLIMTNQESTTIFFSFMFSSVSWFSSNSNSTVYAYKSKSKHIKLVRYSKTLGKYQCNQSLRTLQLNKITSQT